MGLKDKNWMLTFCKRHNLQNSLIIYQKSVHISDNPCDTCLDIWDKTRIEITDDILYTWK